MPAKFFRKAQPDVSRPYLVFISIGVLAGVIIVCPSSATAQMPPVGGNRLAYLDGPCDPVYPHGGFARLETPQWVGEQGVDAVVVLSVDDLRDTKRFEEFLRPIADRLKALYGRAPLSLMANKVDPQDPLVQQWLAEGMSIETHTFTHPCPLLQEGDFAAAKKSYDDCIELLSQIPGMVPRAVRIPCCDSMSSPSPRFYAEIFSRTTPAGRFLWMDSSIFVLFTRIDSHLPPDVVVDEAGKDRFATYIPIDRELGTFVEDYPYPYVIANLCWEIPVVIPSDWNAQRVNGRCHPNTLRDWQKALDAVVAKRGIWSLCFHPHGWIAAEQIVAFVDYAAEKYGQRVKFLNFADVLSRLETNLLAGQSLRAQDGSDNGVRILDVNSDGWMDVVIANDCAQQTRIWDPYRNRWQEHHFPVALASSTGGGTKPGLCVHFGIVAERPGASLLVLQGDKLRWWTWVEAGWQEVPELARGLEEVAQNLAGWEHADRGLRLRDLDGDGWCELLVASPRMNAVFRWQNRSESKDGVSSTQSHAVVPSPGQWRKLPFTVPGLIVDEQGRDAGLRFVDLDGDQDLDAVLSAQGGWLVARMEGIDTGWEIVRQGRSDDPQRIPSFVAPDGSNFGAWFKFGRLWIQNEYTGRWVGEGPNRFRVAADWISFGDLLKDGDPPQLPAEPTAGGN